ncbi:hypothetical protein TrCOL_g13703 [Triparma columacea]|uniref:tRNA/rRNA methyltransferase SpoU type domain-containing protein n=1 Tax=Triparma columacea TaxID=722753 RepID=A0A9W7LBQ6_9STRA|nr:hypothetical protein TrCOL_g13703 [Triparma columacea]
MTILPDVPSNVKSEIASSVEDFIINILTTKTPPDDTQECTIVALRTSCGILLNLPPTKILVKVAEYVKSMDATERAIRGVWVAKVLKIIQSYLQVRQDDSHGCISGVKSLVSSNVTGFLLGALILCHQSHPEVKEELDMEEMEETIFQSLGMYYQQEKTLGHGNWVPDSKARGGQERGDVDLDEDPTVVRRRGIKAGEILFGEDGGYWTAWGVVECEFQEHIVNQVFKLLESLPENRRGKWLERVLTRGLRSDVPMIRKGFLGRIMGGKVGVEGVMGEWWDKAKVGCGKKKGKKGKKGKEVVPDEAIGSWSKDFVKNSMLTSLDSCGGHLNKIYTVDNKSIDLQVVTREWLSKYFGEVGDVDTFLDRDWGDSLQITTLEDLLAGLAGVDGEVSCEMKSLVGIISTLKTVTWIEPRGTREKLYEYTAGFLGKLKVGGIKAAEDVLFVLSYFPAFDSYHTSPAPGDGSEAIASSSPPPYAASLQKFVANLPNGFAAQAPAVLNSMFIEGLLKYGGHAGAMDEESTSKAICLLAGCTDGGACLWPGIMKASQRKMRMYGDKGHMERAARVISDGVRNLVLGGAGNGEVLVDKAGNIARPPVEIEEVLGEVGGFLVGKVASEVYTVEREKLRGTTQQVKGGVEVWAGQIEAISKGFGNSLKWVQEIEEMGRKGWEGVKAGGDGIEVVGFLNQILISLNALPPPSKMLPQFLIALNQVYKNAESASSSSEEQFARSTFMKAKWGILRFLGERGAIDVGGIKVAERVSEEVFAAVDCCVPSVLGDVFTVGFHACRVMVASGSSDMHKLISSMWNFVEESEKGSEKQRMCATICRLVFTPDTVSGEEAHAPLLELAEEIMGEKRKRMPLMGRACAVYVVNALKGGSDDAKVRWREWILELVLHKEEKKSKTEKFEAETYEVEGFGEYVPETSMSRAIGLSYLDWLGKELSVGRVGSKVRRDLGEWMLLTLLSTSAGLEGEDLAMIGTKAYCRQLRSWQACCMLAGFVGGDDAAERACELLWRSIRVNTHGSIRHYIEVFAIKMLRKFPKVTSRGLMECLRRVDMGAQVSSSLLVVAGYGMLGGGGSESGAVRGHLKVEEVMAAVCPWLGSTQGFSRGIAQLVCWHCLKDMDLKGNDYLERLFFYLDENKEMGRLRGKTTKFFDSLDVEKISGLEGILEVEYDSEENPMPKSVIEGLKETMVEIFNDAHPADRVPGYANSGKGNEKGEEEEDEDEEEEEETGDGGTVQRKIMPFDILSLSDMRSVKSRSVNAAGRSLSSVKICASLIDKPPNLGGLARTCEIFGVGSLIMPDLRISKMDNFKATSVSAERWVNLEECQEKDLFSYLSHHRSLGYKIIAVEQCSTSIPLQSYPFPSHGKVVILLGDEKRGVPVELLNVVDGEVEIPQRGVTRSLNVHVCGAVVVWECLKQLGMLG